MFKDEEFVAYEIVNDMSMAIEFRDIYGMRFLGLEDQFSSAYGDYAFPNAEAPYPRDVVIDAEGRIRYWSTEYDPQKIIEVIGELLGTTVGVEAEIPISATPIRWTPAVPNPFRADVSLHWSSPQGGWSLGLFDATGRLLEDFGRFERSGDQQFLWDGRDRDGRELPAGVYFFRLDNGKEHASQRVLRIN